MICHITIKTAKFQESVDFYQWLLGLPLSNRIKTPGGEIVFLGENETKFELIADNNAERINAESISIGFKIDNLDEKIKMLNEKQIPHSEIISTPNARFLFFTDLNGCSIQLFESK